MSEGNDGGPYAQILVRDRDGVVEVIVKFDPVLPESGPVDGLPASHQLAMVIMDWIEQHYRAANVADDGGSLL